MKRVLGLDLGTNSIGWALVNEAENDNEVSEIIKLGVRVNPLTTDEKADFEKGKPLSTNADRTLKRSARRNLQRYKLRRENLIEILIKNGFITKNTPLTETGKDTTHQTLEIRAKAATEQLTLEELARVLLTINKKRGYKSSRKARNEEEGQTIDGMQVAKELYDKNITPGQYVLGLLTQGKKYIPDFYRSDLKSEFDKVWDFQKQYYPEVLDDDLYKALEGQGQQNSRKRFLAIKGIYTAVNKGKRDEVKLQHYKWRADAINKKLNIEEVAYVLVEINNNLNQSSGYLGEISDRSKELYFNKETVGQYLWKQITENPHTSLKNQVFYRQDYLDEFEKIWETQSKYYPETLTEDLKEEIRDVIIFYQRKLKSQKALLSICQFENWEIDKKDADGNIKINPLTKMPQKVTVGRKVIAKSSPLFQEFKVWQGVNNISLKMFTNNEQYALNEEQRKLLFEELNLRGNLSESEIFKILGFKAPEWKTNYKEGLEGNRTNAALYNAYQMIAEAEGYGYDWAKKSASEIKEELRQIFPLIGINPEILDFDANADDLEAQKSYQLWHLLYATEDDEKISEEDKIIFGNSAVSLKKKLVEKFGFKPEHAKILANISLSQDYGNLSAKAIRKIIPYLQAGHIYPEACTLAGYNHSKSLTAEENEARQLAEKMEILPRNSLRNPVVEKILNQMVNIINEIIDTYGKPDEVRIELARELKKSAKERKEMTEFINQRTKENEDIKKLLVKEFGIPNPTKSDILRYRLYEELAPLGYKDVFTNQYIHRNELFSKHIDIEHIIPKTLLFDDSLSNKTLAFRQVNIKKANRTAYDYISSDNNLDLEEYINRVEILYNGGKGTISKAKRNKLLIAQKDLDFGFIERDLRNSQYIAKEARKMLLKVFRNVMATSGSITDKLREDWGIINVMKELNFPKYKAVGMTEIEQRLNKGTGELVDVEVIKDWTKRNDHRHHAMDALAVAFTKHSHIQYLNHLNARKDVNNEKHSLILNIENKITHRITDENGKSKKVFIAPMPDFRARAKEHIENILVSIKNKNKVVTKNTNITKKKGGVHKKVQLTPRGQLHKETVYGKSKVLMNKSTKLNKAITTEQIELIANPVLKSLVKEHVEKYGNNPQVAFDTKTLKKDLILYRDEPLKEVLCYEEIFTIRKDITPDLKIDKVVDAKVKELLKDRLASYNGNPKEAFSDLEKNPIWLNKEKGISIKRVTITGVSNTEALHSKKDHFGYPLKDSEGNAIPADFVSTGNNHHVAIYRDNDGNLQESVVSFFEAVTRANMGLPIIDKSFNKDLGWEFLFTMKQNEMFVFPNDDFDSNEIDLMDEKNAGLISKHLFRVQKIATKNYFFRHHLETTVETLKELDVIAYRSIRSVQNVEGIVKVRINHLGKIVQVGEY